MQLNPQIHHNNKDSNKDMISMKRFYQVTDGDRNLQTDYSGPNYVSDGLHKDQINERRNSVDENDDMKSKTLIPSP